MTEISKAQIIRAIDKMVREGRAVHTLIDGQPGIRLIKNAGVGDVGRPSEDGGEPVETQVYADPGTKS